jgi:hypothetical protein
MTSAISYVDGVGRVTVVNGVAHIDLVTVVPAAQEGGKAQIQVSHRLAMNLPQFVRLCTEMSAHLQNMESKGLIRRTDATPAS